jgi:hypothetical protein
MNFFLSQNTVNWLLRTPTHYIKANAVEKLSFISLKVIINLLTGTKEMKVTLPKCPKSIMISTMPTKIDFTSFMIALS